MGGAVGPLGGALTRLVAMLAARQAATYGVNVRIMGLMPPSIGPRYPYEPMRAGCERETRVKLA